MMPDKRGGGWRAGGSASSKPNEESVVLLTHASISIFDMRRVKSEEDFAYGWLLLRNVAKIMFIVGIYVHASRAYWMP